MSRKSGLKDEIAFEKEPMLLPFEGFPSMQPGLGVGVLSLAQVKLSFAHSLDDDDRPNGVHCLADAML